MPKKRPIETPVPKRSTGIKIAHQPPLPTPATAKAEPKTPAVVSKSDLADAMSYKCFYESSCGRLMGGSCLKIL